MVERQQQELLRLQQSTPQGGSSKAVTPDVRSTIRELVQQHHARSVDESPGVGQRYPKGQAMGFGTPLPQPAFLSPAVRPSPTPQPLQHHPAEADGVIVVTRSNNGTGSNAGIGAMETPLMGMQSAGTPGLSALFRTPVSAGSSHLQIAQQRESPVEVRCI